MLDSNKFLFEALTYDDVLLLPAYSEVLPREVSTQTRLTRNITINIPIISAAMDTVTEAALAIALAQEGGIGIIHKNMTIDQQAAQVRKVKRSESGMIIDPVTLKDNKTLGDAQRIMKEFKISKVISSNQDNLYRFECGTIEVMIFPNKIESSNPNNNSIVSRVTIGGKSYLFTGDIEEKREKELLEYNLQSDYLKVAHHGSITSSSDEFIAKVRPEEVFVIVSSRNKHGHPHDVIMNKFHDLGVPVRRTDLMGTIETIYLFGKEIKRYPNP